MIPAEARHPGRYQDDDGQWRICMSAITALTAQNTTGVTAIMEATEEFLGEELDNIFTDIFPDAVKIGMVSSSGLIIKIAEKLKEYDAKISWLIRLWWLPAEPD